MLSIICALLCIHAALADVTCPGLGTFENTGPFDGWPDPSCPGDANFDLVHTLYNSDSGSNNGQVITSSGSIPSIFNPSYDTVFVIHGWTGSDETGWMDSAKDALISNDNVNVVVVGWGGSEGAGDINYFNSASDTRTVGAETAEVMINLIDNGNGQASRMQFAGHSLGAHCSGHAGRWNSAYTPARIFGLDPAGPFFINNTDRSVGLYNDCADFVQILHTDQRYGSSPDDGGTDVYLGHQDFFVNGGDEQGGCTTDTCDHGRATQLFTDSITSPCSASQECTNSADIPGSCSSCSTCPVMGYTASDNNDGRFVTTTADSAPFC